EVVQDALWLRLGGDVRDGRRLEGVADDLNDLRRGKAKIHAEVDPHPVGSELTVPLSENLDRLRQELRVRHDERVPIARLQHGVPPSDLPDLSLQLALELDP